MFKVVQGQKNNSKQFITSPNAPLKHNAPSTALKVTLSCGTFDFRVFITKKRNQRDLLSFRLLIGVIDKTITVTKTIEDKTRQESIIFITALGQLKMEEEEDVSISYLIIDL